MIRGLKTALRVILRKCEQLFQTPFLHDKKKCLHILNELFWLRIFLLLLLISKPKDFYLFLYYKFNYFCNLS